MQKNAIVSGGLGAVGTAIVNKLQSIGYHITATLGPKDQAENDAESNVTYQKVDLTIDGETKRFVDDYLSREANIDLLVLTVGGFSMGSLEQTTMNSINRMIDLNFHTAFNVVKPAVKKMCEQVPDQRSNHRKAKMPWLTVFPSPCCFPLQKCLMLNTMSKILTQQ